jgi:hypothetical protein
MSGEDDVPMPIKVAVEKCFPFGGLKKFTLMNAIREGRLAYEKHGKAYFVTKRDIEQWRNASRVAAKPPVDEKFKEARVFRRVAAKPSADERSKEAVESCLRNAKRLQKGLPVR